MKKRDLISGATIVASSLAAHGAIAGSAGEDHLFTTGYDGTLADTSDIFGDPPTDADPADPDLIAVALDPSDSDDLFAPLLEAEFHGTYFGGAGGDMIRVPGTELREVKSPRGRTFTIQVNTQTREVFSPAGEKLDPPPWLVEQLRAGG